MVVSHRRGVLVSVPDIGSIAVSVSRVHGCLTHPNVRWDIMRGVPLYLCPLRTA